MVLGTLREKLGPTIYDKPLIRLGKIVIALAAIIYVFGGLVEVIQASISLLNGGKIVASFFWIILWGSLKITLGYGYYTLLDMKKDGLIASIAKLFAILGAGIMMIYSLMAIIYGLLIIFFPDPHWGASISVGDDIVFSVDSGVFFLLVGGIAFCIGLGVIYFIHERDKFQNSEKMRKSENI